MAGWNLANVWETIAGQLPDAPAVIHDGRVTPWAGFDRRADGLARALLAAGLERHDRVAQCLYNGPEYLESLFAALKVSLVPVNTNYRYGGDEFVYLWADAGVSAVVFCGSFTETIAEIRHRLPHVRAWLWVDDGSGPCPDWARCYEDAAESSGGRPAPAWQRDGDDLILLHTGGTTGMPKGVMWRQDDLFTNLNRRSPLPYVEGRDADPEVVRERVTGPNRRLLAAAPLMHGTGLYPAISHLSVGGSVVTLSERSFDPRTLLTAVERDRANTIVWVGDAFAKPVLRALDESPGRWPLDSLGFILSAGVMFSAATKAGLLRHRPGLTIVDAMASSEAFGVGDAVTTGADGADTARFRLGAEARVVADDGRDVAPGEVGRLIVGGRQPLGYWNDPGKTAAAFRVIDGVRYAVPGDWATVAADGTFTLLGRGSSCINSGGEKIFPEEVEEVIKEHHAVADVVVVGVPDERFGEVVTAVVETEPDATVDHDELIAHVRARLAGYKAPRHVVVVDSIGRAPNGKADLRRLKALAAERLGVAT